MDITGGRAGKEAHEEKNRTIDHKGIFYFLFCSAVSGIALQGRSCMEKETAKRGADHCEGSQGSLQGTGSGRSEGALKGEAGIVLGKPQGRICKLHYIQGAAFSFGGCGSCGRGAAL